ncbi:hypothetical protein MIMGU_mgv11b015993mg [Erythranthe guttata]|uniref:Uncharacterized protein n=1 Tax=Erythranthe guttata TaxID=4155 RepID=A0A022QL17_ERYGU|nr:hypothetical protein MIMGU_mgv11b015993mg [Erythranthe guttata]
MKTQTTTPEWTLIQINKHAQTHSLKLTCTSIHVKKHAQKCIRNNVLKSTEYNTRTLMRITKQQQKHKIQKIQWKPVKNWIPTSDHENTRYSSRTRMRIKETCTKTLASKDTHISKKKHAQKCIRNNVLKNTEYNTRTLMRITKQQQKHKIQKIQWSVEITLNVYVYVDFLMD